MNEKMKNILIGLFVVTAVTIIIAMILFLEPRIGDGKKILEVRFANIAGIVQGTRVTFAGKPVGEVIAIREIKDARSETIDETGKVYFYQLTLKIDSSVTVYSTDEVAIRTTGLMGEKSIAILPKAAPKGKASYPVTEGEILIANSIDPLENTFSQVSKAANRLQEAATNFDHWFQANQLVLSNTIGSLNSVLGRGDSLLKSIDEEQLILQLSQSTGLLNENLSLIRDGLDQKQILSKTASLLDNLDKAADSFNQEGAEALHYIQQFTHDLATGSGTLGRLVTGEDVYLRLNSLLSKADTLMNDINHYGILFQYDKHWQRSRTKKANLLKALDTPREFRDYFEGEIDSISTSLGRLTELLDRADGERSKIAENEDFKKQFGHLMRSAQSLSDAIKLYNQELIAQSE